MLGDVVPVCQMALERRPCRLRGLGIPRRAERQRISALARAHNAKPNDGGVATVLQAGSEVTDTTLSPRVPQEHSPSPLQKLLPSTLGQDC